MPTIGDVLAMKHERHAAQHAAAEAALDAKKNRCGKTVAREKAYEVWQAGDAAAPGSLWTWYVLKKYQSPAAEAKNAYARWFCCVVTPMVGDRGEYGDVYVREIKSQARRIK